MKNKQFTQCVGNLIRQQRQLKGLTIEHVAFHASIDYSTLSRIERGKSNPSFLVVYRIIDVLDMHESFMNLLKSRLS